MQQVTRRRKRKLSTKKVVIFAAAVLAAIAILVTGIVLIVNAVNTKNITVVVNDTSAETRSVFRITTREKYLVDALLERGLIAGGEHDEGFVIEKADGVAVDHSKNQCWAIHVNGKRGEQDASKIVIKNKDSIELRLEYLE